MGLQLVPLGIANNNDAVPGPQTALQHPVELYRNLVKGLTLNTGVFHYGDFAVTPGTGLTVNVAAGQAALLGVEATLQGSYFVWSQASEVLTIGSPSASTRYDSVILRVVDPQYGTITGNSRAYWDVVQGAPGAGVPRADSYFNSGGTAYIPGAWFRVADIRVVPAASSFTSPDITQNPQYIEAPGGVRFCTSTSRPTPTLGKRIFETDTGLSWWYDGTAYRLAIPFKKTTLLATTAINVSFSVPTNLRSLRLRYTARGDAAFSNINVWLRINSDGGANYAHEAIAANNAAAPATVQGTSQTWGYSGNITAASNTAGRFGAGEVNIIGWNAPHNRIDALFQSGFMDQGVGAFAVSGMFEYAGNGPYSAVTLWPNSGNFIAGSEFVLEGWD